MHAHIVVNAVGSVIDMYSVPSLKNFSPVSVLDYLTIAYLCCSTWKLIQFLAIFSTFNVKAVFLLTASSLKGSREICWHLYTQALFKTTGANDDCSLEGAFEIDRQIRR